MGKKRKGKTSWGNEQRRPCAVCRRRLFDASLCVGFFCFCCGRAGVRVCAGWVAHTLAKKKSVFAARPDNITKLTNYITTTELSSKSGHVGPIPDTRPLPSTHTPRRARPRLPPEVSWHETWTCLRMGLDWLSFVCKCKRTDWFRAGAFRWLSTLPRGMFL